MNLGLAKVPSAAPSKESSYFFRIFLILASRSSCASSVCNALDSESAELQQLTQSLSIALPRDSRHKACRL